MAFVLDPAQEDLLQAEHSEGKMSPEKAAAWEAYLTQKPQLPADAPVITTPPEPPPKAPAVRERLFPEGDPRNDSSWYQRAMERLGRGVTTTDPMGGSVPTIPDETRPPGERVDIAQSTDEGARYGLRHSLETGASLLPMTWPARAAWAGGKIPWLMDALTRAHKSGLLSGGATMVGNVIDPYTKTPVGEAYAWNAVGEGLGGVAEDVLKGTGALLRRPFQETPAGTIQREVIERAGGELTPSMVSEGIAPRTVDRVLKSLPTPGNRIAAVYDATHQKIQDEMKLLQQQHPGGKVTQEVTDIGQAIQTAGDPAMVTPAAKGVRSTVTKVIDDTNAKYVKGYADLDATYRQYPAEWGQSQPLLPTATQVEDLLLHPSMAAPGDIGSHSIFTETLQLTEALRNLPPTLTVDGVIDMARRNEVLLKEAQKHVDDALAKAAAGDRTAWTGYTQSIQQKVLPTLGQNQDLLNKHLAPYMVDRGPAQDTARQVVGAWEASLMTPESAMQKGGPGRMGVLEDPQIMAARAFIDKPRYALFTEAHNDRSQWLKISRVPGPNMGNDIAREAEGVATALDRAMTKTGEYATGGGLAPGHQLEAQRRAIDSAYRKDAEVLNAPLMMELRDKNLDDIINTFVQPGRVNDMKTLRATLGDNTMDNGAQMWLSKKIDEHTPPSTRTRLPTDPPLGPATGPGQLNNAGLLADLDTINAETAKVLFPHGNLSGIRNRLRQGVDMEAAIKEIKAEMPDLTVVQQLKTRINDPQLWEAVQSDALAPYLRGDVDGLKGATLLAGLEKMGKVRELVFAPGHLKDLQHLGQTMRALDEGKARTFHPLMRHTAAGLLVLGGGYFAGMGTDAPIAYLVGTQILTRGLANQKFVKLLTRGLSTNASRHNWGEVVGGLLGTLHSQGLSNEVVPMTPSGPAPRPQAPPGAEAAADETEGI